MGVLTNRVSVIRRRAMLALFVVAAALICTAPAGAEADEPSLVVIVSAQSSVQNISMEKLRRAFLARPTDGEDGKLIVPVNQARDAPSRVEFDSRVLNMSPGEIARYWIDRLVRGDGKQPKQVGSVPVLRSVVATSRGAYGYVRANELDASVRAIRIDGRSHTDSDYPLRRR